MKTNRRHVLFAALLLAATALTLLPACSSLGGSSVNSRVEKLEADVATNKQEIAVLQQQVQQQKASIDALTPSTTVITTPTTPTATTPDPSAADQAKAKGLLTTDLVVFGNMTITPAQVNTGATVTVSIPVTSNATYKGTYPVALSQSQDPTISNAVTEYSNIVTLNPGETQTVTFPIITERVGVYTVTIAKKTGTFTVVAP